MIYKLHTDYRYSEELYIRAKVPVMNLVLRIACNVWSKQENIWNSNVGHIHTSRIVINIEI